MHKLGYCKRFCSTNCDKCQGSYIKKKKKTHPGDDVCPLGFFSWVANLCSQLYHRNWTVEWSGSSHVTRFQECFSPKYFRFKPQKSFPAPQEKQTPSGHTLLVGSTGQSKMELRCFRLSLYTVLFFFFNKENVYIGIWRVKNWYVSWTRSTWAAGTRAALRRRTARRWRWAAAESWSGSSWSGGEWPSPGPPRIPGGRSEAWWAPAWRSRCSNAARKKDQSACRVNSIQMLTFLGHLFG